MESARYTPGVVNSWTPRVTPYPFSFSLLLVSPARHRTPRIQKNRCCARVFTLAQAVDENGRQRVKGCPVVEHGGLQRRRLHRECVSFVFIQRNGEKRVLKSAVEVLVQSPHDVVDVVMGAQIRLHLRYKSYDYYASNTLESTEEEATIHNVVAFVSHLAGFSSCHLNAQCQSRSHEGMSASSLMAGEGGIYRRPHGSTTQACPFEHQAFARSIPRCADCDYLDGNRS